MYSITSYPNQKIININKKELSAGYLSIDYSDWSNATNNLTYSAFKIYLYLANNTNGYNLALSKVAIQKDLVMSDNTYHNVVKELIDKRYLIHRKGNIYDFYTVPKDIQQSISIVDCNGIYQSNEALCTITIGDDVPSQCDDVYQCNSTEITNITNINKKYLSREADALEVQERTMKKRGLNELSNEELDSIISDYSKRIDYMETKNRLGLNRQVSKETHREAKELLYQREAEEKNKQILKQFSKVSDANISRISSYLGCYSDEVLSALSTIGVDANYMIEWLDSEHAPIFEKEGEVWKENKKTCDSYIDFIKMAVEANPIKPDHSRWGNIFN